MNERDPHDYDAQFVFNGWKIGIILLGLSLWIMIVSAIVKIVQWVVPFFA